MDNLFKPFLLTDEEVASNCYEGQVLGFKDTFELTPDLFKLLFPNAKLTRSTSPYGKEAVYLAMVKMKGIKALRRKHGLTPPKGVSYKRWVCVFGRLCRHFSESVSSVDTKIARRIALAMGFTVTHVEESGFEDFFVSKVFPEFSLHGLSKAYSGRKDKKFSAISDKVVEPTCLLPVNKGSDLERLHACFPHLRHTDKQNCYFACFPHFKQMRMSDAKTAVKGTSNCTRLAWCEDARGDLKLTGFEGSKQREVANIKPFHSGCIDDVIDKEIEDAIEANEK